MLFGLASTATPGTAKNKQERYQAKTNAMWFSCLNLIRRTLFDLEL